MKKKRILIDMDDVLAKLVKEWTKVVNLNENEEVCHTSIKSWDFSSYFKCGEKTNSYLNYELFRNLELMENSVEVVKNLSNHYEIYIVSSAIKYPESLVAKVEWLQEHFPFIPLDKIILCGDKRAITGDIMIDDGAHNLEHFDGLKLMFDAHHNQTEHRFMRVKSWKQIEEILLGVL